jgi:site-specific DNA-methyltransferase (adenine-specific)
MTAQLHFGRWQEALAHVDAVDAVICDPPYGARTHEATNDHIAGNVMPDGAGRTPIAYDAMMPSEVAAFVDAWAPRCSGWMLAMTDDELVPVWKDAMRAAGRYAFAAVPIIQKRPRLAGDGPSSWAVYAVVSRPRNREFATWGCLPGAYEAPTVKDAGLAEAKPLDLMRAIVRDYSRPGDLVCDPFVGSGTTLLAAVMEGRRAVGAEEKHEHFEIARKRLARGYTPTMFAE